MLGDTFNVLQPKLGLDDLHIPQRVDVPFNVNDFRVVESADDLENAVDRSDVRQESVA